jgi:hypothetical protein
MSLKEPKTGFNWLWALLLPGKALKNKSPNCNPKAYRIRLSNAKQTNWLLVQGFRVQRFRGFASWLLVTEF